MPKLFYFSLTLLYLALEARGGTVSLSRGEREFLEQARQRDFIGRQARSELLLRPEVFFSGLLKREQILAREGLEKSLENAWQVRDDFEMQELFFQILERELSQE